MLESAVCWLNLNGRIVLLEKAVRTIPYGFLSVILMSMVPESDRTAALGLTNVSGTTAQTFSPSLAAYAIVNLWFGSPFVFAGTLKIAYDVLLYRVFRGAKPPQEA